MKSFLYNYLQFIHIAHLWSTFALNVSVLFSVASDYSVLVKNWQEFLGKKIIIFTLKQQAHL